MGGTPSYDKLSSCSSCLAQCSSAGDLPGQKRQEDRAGRLQPAPGYSAACESQEFKAAQPLRLRTSPPQRQPRKAAQHGLLRLLEPRQVCSLEARQG